MGTSARVSIKIRPESKGLIKFHVNEWRDKPNRGYYDTECNLMVYDNIMSIMTAILKELAAGCSRTFVRIRRLLSLSCRETVEVLTRPIMSAMSRGCKTNLRCLPTFPTGRPQMIIITDGIATTVKSNG